MWMPLAISASLIFAIVSVIDKRLLAHDLPNVSVLMIWTVIGMVFYAVVILGITGIPYLAAPRTIIVCLCSGLSLGLGISLMFLALKYEEASRAIAIVNTNPIFVTLLAIPFLGEYLSPAQWVALLLIVTGSALVSIKRSDNNQLLEFSRFTPLLILSSFCWGFAHLLAKSVLEDLPLPTVFAMQQLGVAIVLACYIRKSSWDGLLQCMKDRNTCILMIVGEAILPYIAIFAGLAAISYGPVSLVTSVLASRPMFVFLFASLLSTKKLSLLDETLTKETIGLKLVSIPMIVLGVVLLNAI
ncbi:MAG: hypothetical protein CL886_03240 [Dehalococcoidia bacterium]|nr:hypothetical protein [Dehalococcoidia bacterium]